MATKKTEDRGPGHVTSDVPSPKAERDQTPPASSPTPLPKKEFAVLFFILCNESIAMTVLFPFVGLLIVHMNPDMRRADAGSLSGAIVAAFQFSQIFFSRYWGAKSDKIGRRPAIMYGILGAMVSVIIFGFAPDVRFAIAARLLQGMASGNAPVCKTSIAELTDSSNEAMGFAWMNAGWSVGSMIGPVIGGLAYAPCGSFDGGAATVATGGSGQRAENATKTTSSATTSLLTTMITTTNSSSCFYSPFPTSPAPPSLTDQSSSWLCHTFPIFADRPQLLPCLIVAVYNLLTLVMAYFVLPETNQRVAAAAANHRAASAKIPVPTTADDGDGESDHVELNAIEVRTAATTSAVASQQASQQQDNDGNDYEMQEASRDGAVATSDKQSMQPSTTTTEATPTKFGYKQVFQNGALVRCISTYMCCCAVGIVLNEVLPLLAILPTADGGYGWNAQEVGVLWTITAFFALFMNFCLNPLIARFGRLRVAKVSYVTWALTMVAFPALSSFADTNGNNTENKDGAEASSSSSSLLFYGLLCVVSLIRVACTSWCFALSTMFIAAQAPREHLGSVTGLSHSSGNIVRCVVPLIVTPLFAWSVRTHDRPFPFDSYFVFLLSSVVAVAGMWLLVGLKDSDVIRSKDNNNNTNNKEDESGEATKTSTNTASDGDDDAMMQKPATTETDNERRAVNTSTTATAVDVNVVADGGIEDTRAAVVAVVAKQQQEQEQGQLHPVRSSSSHIVRGEVRDNIALTVLSGEDEDDNNDDEHRRLVRRESMSPDEEAIAQTAFSSPIETMNCLSRRATSSFGPAD